MNIKTLLLFGNFLSPEEIRPYSAHTNQPATSGAKI